MRNSGRHRSWPLAHALAIPVFALIYAAVAWRWGASLMQMGTYLGVSLLTFVAYARDKAAARAGQWRTPEKTLHLLALACGWPGALLAQQLLRHKTSKPGFMATFWFTVLINVVGFVGWQSGYLSKAFSSLPY